MSTEESWSHSPFSVSPPHISGCEQHLSGSGAPGGSAARPVDKASGPGDALYSSVQETRTLIWRPSAVTPPVMTVCPHWMLLVLLITKIFS